MRMGGDGYVESTTRVRVSLLLLCGYECLLAVAITSDRRGGTYNIKNIVTPVGKP